MSNNQIRLAVEKDLLAVLKLLHELGYQIQDHPDFRNTFSQILNNPDSGILIAMTNGSISGYLAFSIKPQLRLMGLSLEIDELSVHSNFRGAGVGSQLIKHVVHLALSRGVKKVTISTNRQRESYQRNFYVKNGFIEKNSALLYMDL
jgi:ribosomal protein S18 acetylase RimI-like enzyme